VLGLGMAWRGRARDGRVRRGEVETVENVGEVIRVAEGGCYECASRFRRTIHRVAALSADTELQRVRQELTFMLGIFTVAMCGLVVVGLIFGEVWSLFLLVFPAMVVLFMTPVYRAFRERTFDVLVDVVPPEEHRH
jgi:hypothetical protein